MASSSSFATCTLCRGSFAPEVTRNGHTGFVSCPNIVSNLPNGAWSASASAEFTQSKLLLSNQKSEKWNSTSLRNLIQCCALEVKKSPSFAVGNKFQLNDVIEAQQFDRDTLSAIFDVAREMEKIEKNSIGSQLLKGYLMATLFYEPSTRTRLSFESAMKRLGGEVLTTENAREFSSAAKGETLEGISLFMLYIHDLSSFSFFLLTFWWSYAS